MPYQDVYYCIYLYPSDWKMVYIQLLLLRWWIDL